MNIFICGGEFRNKGAEAMTRTVQAELSVRLPEIRFFLWQIPVGDHRAALNSGFVPITLSFNRSDSMWHRIQSLRGGLLLWCLNEFCRTGSTPKFAGMLDANNRFARACSHYLDRTIGGFDVLIDVSGFAYGDDWGMGGFQKVRSPVYYCNTHGNLKFFMPQAWGTFNNPEVNNALCELLNTEKTFYYSRDESSSRYLEKALGKPPHSIRSYPDIAFCFQGGTAVEGEQILRGMGCSMQRPILGIAPNMRVYERVKGEGTGNGYLGGLVNLIEYCLEHYDVDVVLQANEIDSFGDRVDDRYLCSLIAASVKNKERCFMTRDPLSAESTKAMIGRFEFLIGSRFHSLVFGFSQGVPGMAISWSHKYRELFSLFDMRENVHECRDIDQDSLVATFERCWNERQEFRSLIVKKSKELKMEVRRVFDEVAHRIRVESTTRHV